MTDQNANQYLTFCMDEADIQPAPQIGLKIDSSFIRGITNQDERFIIILNIKKIFSERELEVMIMRSKLRSQG